MPPQFYPEGRTMKLLSTFDHETQWPLWVCKKMLTDQAVQQARRKQVERL